MTIEKPPLIDAREAASALRLPYYWFADRKQRAAKKIPHYALGSLVRFRLAELTVWAKATGVFIEEEAP